MPVNDQLSDEQLALIAQRIERKADNITDRRRLVAEVERLRGDLRVAIATGAEHVARMAAEGQAEVERLRAALAAQPQPLFEAVVKMTMPSSLHMDGTHPVTLAAWAGTETLRQVKGQRVVVYPAVAGSATPITHSCVAKGCDDDAITEFTDGNGMILWLCEDHGDELAVGFPLKDAADQITCPRCGGAGFIHTYEAVAGSATPTGDDE